MKIRTNKRLTFFEAKQKANGLPRPLAGSRWVEKWDGWTDTLCYRDARTHVKSVKDVQVGLTMPTVEILPVNLLFVLIHRWDNTMSDFFKQLISIIFRLQKVIHFYAKVAVISEKDHKKLNQETKNDDRILNGYRQLDIWGFYMGLMKRRGNLGGQEDWKKKIMLIICFMVWIILVFGGN